MLLLLYYPQCRSLQRPLMLLPRRQQYLRCQPPFPFPVLSPCQASCLLLLRQPRRPLLLRQRHRHLLLHYLVPELLVKHTQIRMEPITLSLVI